MSKMAIDAEIWVTGAANNISTQIRQLDIQTEMYITFIYNYYLLFIIVEYPA